MAPKLPVFTEEELSPKVQQLLEVLRYQMELIQALRDEIAVLKGNKPKPKIKSSWLNQNDPKSGHSGKRPGSEKEPKTEGLEIHETKTIKADDVPEGSEFKGYKDFVIQDLMIQCHNTLYRMERWLTPDGTYVNGQLPSSVEGHFGSTLKSYILYQYHQCQVTQPLILEELQEFGIEISSGQINNILIEGRDNYHEEKAEILATGLAISSHVNVDDTGARHDGKNGYCTHIGNDLFAWFESTESKSRISFLELLRAGRTDYVLIDESYDYMTAQKLPKNKLELLESGRGHSFSNEAQWLAYLGQLGICEERHVRAATEGALIGSLLTNGFNKDLVIVSDDAGQFNVFLHALCWIHAERLINKLVPYTKPQRKDWESIRDQIWALYRELKQYKENPSVECGATLTARFDEIFTTKTCYTSLNLALERLHKNKNELLLCIERPEIPLHNNASENDIREYVKRRKVSGGTRSPDGRRGRDTFTSLKKTCRKLGVSFWQFLNDRVSEENSIAPLPTIMWNRASPSTY